MPLKKKKEKNKKLLKKKKGKHKRPLKKLKKKKEKNNKKQCFLDNLQIDKRNTKMLILKTIH